MKTLIISIILTGLFSIQTLMAGSIEYVTSTENMSCSEQVDFFKNKRKFNLGELAAYINVVTDLYSSIDEKDRKRMLTLEGIYLQMKKEFKRNPDRYDDNYNPEYGLKNHIPKEYMNIHKRLSAIVSRELGKISFIHGVDPQGDLKREFILTSTSVPLSFRKKGGAVLNNPPYFLLEIKASTKGTGSSYYFNIADKKEEVLKEIKKDMFDITSISEKEYVRRRIDQKCLLEDAVDYLRDLETKKGCHRK